MGKYIKNLIIFILIVIIFVIIFNLKIKNIKVTGNENIENSYIIKQFINSDSDTNLCLFLIKKVLFKNKDIPLIESYEIKLNKLDEVEIEVKEKKPILFLKADIKKILIDDKGYVLSINENVNGLTEVCGINFTSPEKGEKLKVNDNDNFLQILKIVSLLNKNGIKVDLIDVNKDNGINVYIDKITVNFGKFVHIDTKIDRLIKIYDKIKDFKGVLDLKDARDGNINEEYIFKKIN